MKKYLINIEETLTKVVEVYAENLDDAFADVEYQYHNGDIILYPDDFCEANAIFISNDNERVEYPL